MLLEKKRGGVFLYGWGFFPLLFGFGMQMMSQLDEQAGEVSWTLIPAHAGCDSCVTTSVPPQHALQGKTLCYRASITSLQSQMRTFYFNLRLYLKKSIIVSSA